MNIYNYDDFVWFDYLEMDFDAIEDKSDRYIILEYMDWRKLGDILGMAIQPRREICSSRLSKRWIAIISLGETRMR